ncbi:hypothetical protein JXA12_05730 [Candidatus Woesearchaeota archaeon]|nr:hypothetical protein [Candidatus Woesearchaeota archaeon]
MNGRLAKTLTIIILTLAAAGAILATSFSDGPDISPLNSEHPTTSDNIVCSWDSTDATQQWVSWINGSTVHSGPIKIILPQESHTLTAGTAKRGETWACNVTLSNGTANITASTGGFTIKNAPPTAPNATDRTFYEDQTAVFTIKSTDADGDTTRYYLIDPAEADERYCTVGETTGEVSCTPNKEDNGTTRYEYLVLDLNGGYNGKNITYQVILVNDPPSITLTDQEAIEDTAFNYSFNVTDEEGHFPINFTFESNLTSINLTQTGSNSAYITFNRESNAPVFGEKGLWWVRVNVTDNGPTSDTPYDNPNATATFLLNVTTINQLPNITTDLDALGLEGTQRQLFNFTVHAEDLDEADTLTFSISSNCTLATDPWTTNISTTNSSPENATALISANLTNDHVVCRWVTITVDDGEAQDEETVWLNLTNKNDPPVINAISDQETVKGATYTYQVSAHDPDELTYEGEELTYWLNDTLFSINTTTGFISTVINDTHVGNHTLLINVSDDDGESDAKTFKVEVKNNTLPVLRSIGDVTCDEGDLCTVYLIVDDPDPGEDFTSRFTSNDTAVFPIVNVNQTAWQHQQYHNDTGEVGSYSINITVADRYGFTDTETFTFTINNTNDAPYFNSVNINCTPIVKGKAYYRTVDVIDEDVMYDLDTLTYNWSFITMANATFTQDFSFTENGTDYFTMRLTPEEGQAGFYEVNLSTTDSEGATHFEIVSFDVLTPSTPPYIEFVRPYWNGTANRTETTMGNASSFPSNRTSINASENSSLVFDAIAINDSSFPYNSLDYHWYLYGSWDSTLTNVKMSGSSSNASYDLTFGFFDEGTIEVVLMIEDYKDSVANWTWEVNITDLNRPPTLINDLPNMTVEGSYKDGNDYFAGSQEGTGLANWRQRFYDPDDDTSTDEGFISPFPYATPPGDGVRTSSPSIDEETSLTYSLAPGESCTNAEITLNGDDVDVVGVAVGECSVVFRATDPYGEYVDSNKVYITVTAINEQEVKDPSPSSSSPRPRPVPIPIDNPVETPYPIELITPKDVFTYANETVEIPLTIKNTWNDTLFGVTLNATADNLTEDVSFRFTEWSFPSLETGENISVSLFIDGYRKEAPLAVVVSAWVDDPEYVDRATVMISSMEQQDSGDDVESKVVFARDLMNDNPECQELVELIDRAEQERLRHNYDEAVKLVETAVNGCKYLINEQKDVEEERPKDFFATMTISPEQLPALIIGGVIVIILLVFGIIMLFSGRKDGSKLDI